MSENTKSFGGEHEEHGDTVVREKSTVRRLRGSPSPLFLHNSAQCFTKRKACDHAETWTSVKCPPCCVRLTPHPFSLTPFSRCSVERNAYTRVLIRRYIVYRAYVYPLFLSFSSFPLFYHFATLYPTCPSSCSISFVAVCTGALYLLRTQQT